MKTKLSKDHQDILLKQAHASIHHGFINDSPIPLDIKNFPKCLQEQRASFVSIYQDNILRGCVGRLKVNHPLIQDVVENAFNAAFNDDRFDPIEEHELKGLKIRISILSEPELIKTTSESKILESLQPTMGLILQHQEAMATFLPIVWESIDNPVDFLGELKRKAGLPRDFWSKDIKIYHYSTEEFE